MMDSMSVRVMVWGAVGMLVVYRGLLKIVGFMSRDVVKCNVCLCSGCVFLFELRSVVVDGLFRHPSFDVSVLCASCGSS